MKNILITGGAGFIGSKLSLFLLDKGFNVTVLDNLKEQIHGINPEENSSLYQLIKGKVRFIKGSVNNLSNIAEAINGQDAIIHLAAETGTGQSMYDINKYTETNIGGTSQILDFLVNNKHAVKKFVVASSRAIYGEGRYFSKKYGYVYPLSRSEADMKAGDFEVKYTEDKSETIEFVSTDEDSLIHPTSVYGITKQVQEQLVMTVCPTINIAPVSLRYQNVYGPGQSLSNPYTGILSIFSTRIKNNNGINIFEDGKESRDFVYIDDVVYATYLALVKKEAENEIFNVGFGKPIDVYKVANTLIEKYGKNVPVTVSGNYRIGDIRHNFADISKIKTKLGFIPTWSFEQGIEEFTFWVNKQEILDDKYEDSIKEMKNKGLYK